MWYSALMLDVARLLRWGDRGKALAVLEAADELMAGRASVFVAESMGDRHVDAGSGAVELDKATGGALSRLALLTESARRRAPTGDRLRSVVGTILDVTGAYATALTEDGFKLGLPLGSRGDRVFPARGAVVAVDYETSKGSFILSWIRPGLVLSVDSDGRVPVQPFLLSGEERARLTSDDVLLAG